VIRGDIRDEPSPAKILADGSARKKDRCRNRQGPSAGWSTCAAPIPATQIGLMHDIAQRTVAALGSARVSAVGRG
jgi:hypothetical protein